MDPTELSDSDTWQRHYHKVGSHPRNLVTFLVLVLGSCKTDRCAADTRAPLAATARHALLNMHDASMQWKEVLY